jgi:hypothetical protein
MIVREKTDWCSLFHDDRIYEDIVKAVVDLEKKLIAVEADWHSELLTLLIDEEGSNSDDVWGLNLKHDKTIHYTSLINIKPHTTQRSTDIEDEELQSKMKAVVDLWLI